MSQQHEMNLDVGPDLHLEQRQHTLNLNLPRRGIGGRLDGCLVGLVLQHLVALRQGK